MVLNLRLEKHHFPTHIIPSSYHHLGLEIRVLSLWRESGGARTAAAGAEEKKCRTNALEADFLTFSGRAPKHANRARFARFPGARVFLATREPLFLIPSWSKYNVVFLSFLYEYRIRNTSFNLLIPNIENDLAKNFNNENSKLIFRRGKSYRARLTMSLIFRNVVYQTLFLRPPIDKFSWFFLSCKIVR